MCNRRDILVGTQASPHLQYQPRACSPLSVQLSLLSPVPFTMSSNASSQPSSTVGSIYGSAPRRSCVRYLSPASLKLGRVFEQNRQRLQQKDGGKQPDVMAPLPTKGKPRLLLMGQRRYSSSPKPLDVSVWLTISRSGKSSISSVVFHKLPPSETLFLESTARIQKDAMT